LKNIFSLLFDQNSPLSIRPAALPSLTPWLLRFVRQSLPKASALNAEAIAALVASSLQDWRSLAAEVGAEPLLRRNGCLYLYETDAAFAKARVDIDNRRRLGIAVDLIGIADLQALEPAFNLQAGGAAYFSKATSVLDPLELAARIGQAFQDAGGQVLNHNITDLNREKGHVVVKDVQTILRAKTVIIAAGAHSKNLAHQAGDSIPLDTERGYHLEWDMKDLPISRPACPSGRGFYFSPMNGRLRVAGTVELGGLTAPPSSPCDT
jgi:glycine/D-amino acid oxidase-like deaminating enzyme